LAPLGRRSRRANPTTLDVVIRNESGIAGVGVLPIVNLAFAGCIPVVSPQRGRRFDVVVALSSQPNAELGRVPIILKAARNATDHGPSWQGR
jgi:hypothetical protein